jgi:hypothetical protein
MKYYLFSMYILLVTGCTTHVNTANSQAKKVAAPRKSSNFPRLSWCRWDTWQTGVPPLGGRYYDLVKAMHDVGEASSAQSLLGHFLSDDDIKDVI